LVRAAAYKLEEKGRLQEAEHLYRRVLEMRPEEPQSYRDLALVLAKRKQYDECVALFDKIMTRCKPDWDARFSQIEVVSLMDLCGILPFMNQLEVASGFKIPYSVVPAAANPIQVDLRAVLTWDVDGLDLELQVQDPQGEVLNSFSNHSSSGGMLSRDFTGGYGPVEFLARRAFQGLYAFRAKVRSPCSKAILGGEATIRFTTYTNFGNPELQESESRVWRITPSKGLVVDLATVHVGPQRRSRA
jgi:tetratricopeptide (TPR) repeat protein